MQKESKRHFSMMQFIMNDVSRGMRKNIVKYIIAVIFSFMCTNILYRICSSHLQLGDINSLPGFFDGLLYMEQGIPEYIPKKGVDIQIPALWMTMNLLPAFLVSSYVVKDMEGMGLAMLLKYQNRTVWWMSKCVWNIISVLLLYVVIWGSIILYIGVYKNNISGIWSLHQDISDKILGVSYHGGVIYMVALMVAPLILHLGISLLQMALSLLLSPVISFMGVLVLYVLSAYFMNPLLLGNYTMMMRSSMVLSGGVPTFVGVIGGIVLGGLGILIGAVYMRRMDILVKE